MVTRHKPTLDLNQKEKPHQYQVFKLIGEGILFIVLIYFVYLLTGKRLPTIVGIPCFLWDMITRLDHVILALNHVIYQMLVTQSRGKTSC